MCSPATAIAAGTWRCCESTAPPTAWPYAPTARHGGSPLRSDLMTNHVHLVVVPETVVSLCGALKPVHLRYAQEFNRRMGVGGVLWQGRFYSTPLDDRHFWAAVRYVERNPVRAGLVKRAWEYPWSSAAHHCGLRGDDLVSGDLEQSDHVDHWKAFLRTEDEEEVRVLRARTRTGRPCGDEGFVSRLERLVGRRLLPAKGGRPRKNKAAREKHG